MQDTFETLFILGLGAFLAFVLWKASRPRWPIRIVAGPAGVSSVQGVPLNSQAKLRQFLAHDVALPEAIEIFAVKRTGGGLMVRFRGKLDDGQQQQIRNFLPTVL